MPSSLVAVPASHGLAAFVADGQRIRIVNTQGTQVVDTWAFSCEDMLESMSMEHTRSFNSRIYPRVGDDMVSNRRRPILTWLEDTSPGIHDTVLCACNRYFYEQLGTMGHRNCEDNLHEALEALDLAVPTTPNPLNLFMNTPVVSEGAIERQSPVSAAGDHVVFLARMDLVIVFSACPNDLNTINAAPPSVVHFEISD